MEREGPIDFDRLADSREFAEFLELMYRLMGLSIGVYDPTFTRFRPAYDAKRTAPLCQLMHALPGGFDKCSEDGKSHCDAAVRSGQPLRYRCHAGLIDILVPIFSEGRHIATISYGQFLPTPPSNKGFLDFWRKNRHRGLDREAVRKAYYQSPYLPPERIDALIRILQLFANYVCEMGRRLRSLTEASLPVEIVRAKQYIHDHFHEMISAADVAEHSGLATSYLGKRFRKIMGMSFVHYLQQVRVAEAKRLLEQVDLPITKICFDCGFSTVSQFNRVFRRVEKGTPREYRRRCQTAKGPS